MTNSTRVLVVEDDSLLGNAWRETLRRAGHQAQIAGSLAEARSRLEEARAGSQPYGVVVVDLILPDGDGADLRECRPLPGVAVVSGHLDSERSLSLWGKSLIELQKPLTTETMVALVERLTSTDPAATSVDRFCEAYQLTTKQARIVKHTALGWSLGKIAEDLGCAVSTLKGFWKRIHDKTGLRTRREVVSAAWQHRPKP